MKFLNMATIAFLAILIVACDGGLAGTPVPATPTFAPAPQPPAPTTAPTVAPTTAPAATSAPMGMGPLGMKYQYDQGCAATSAPMDYPACVLQRVQSGELTGEQAVVMIQALGQKFSAPSFEDTKLTLPNRQPAIVWCPAGVKVYPPDTARPLSGTLGANWADTLFVVDAGTGGPNRVIESKSTVKCWMVYVR